MRFSALSFVFISVLAIAAATPADPSPIANVGNAATALCFGLNTLLPTVSMLMVVFGAVAYAAGQVMGAETRARANVWATAAVTGALMGMLISQISPSVLNALYGGTISCGSLKCGSATYDSATEVCCGATWNYHVCPSGSGCSESGCKVEEEK